MKTEHEPPTNHVARPAVWLHPIPLLAQKLGETPATRFRMLRDECANEGYIFSGYVSPSIARNRFHKKTVAEWKVERKCNFNRARGNREAAMRLGWSSGDAIVSTE